MTGLLVTFEGPEGAGKTTQIQLLAGYLAQQSLPVEVVREPGGTSLGEKIRDLLLEPGQEICPGAEVYLYAAARAQLVANVIKPLLDKGKIVLCDRFVDASIAYQGWGRGLEPQGVRDANALALDGTWPDLTVLLDIAPEEGIRRVMDRRAGLDRIEQEDLSFHQAVRRGYIELAVDEPARFLVVDAAMPRKEVSQHIFTRTAALLAEKGFELRSEV